MTMRVLSDTVFFTADTHFFHKAMAGKREFQNVDLMNAYLISRWNYVVPTDGKVFHLGDFSFAGTAKTISILGQLNGQVHLVRGNHDSGLSKTTLDCFASVQDYLEIEVEEAPSVRTRIILSHYAHRVWNMSHYGTWHLHGHSHGSMPPIGRSMDVGVDAAMFFEPFPYFRIKERLQNNQISHEDYHVDRRT